MKSYYLILLFLFAVYPNSMAQKVYTQPSPFAKYERGQGLTYEGRQYFRLPSLSALVQSNESEQNQIQQPSSALSPAILARKGQFSVFEKFDNQPQSQSAEDLEEYPVVFNPRSEGIGIVLGFLIVEMKDVDKSRDLAKKYDLLVVEAYPEVKTVIFKGRYPSQVLESIRQLQSEPTVSRAEIEVLENLKVPL